MASRGKTRIVTVLGVCGVAMGVSLARAQVLLYEQTHDGTQFDEEARPTSPAVGVGEVAVVAAGTRYLALFNKNGTQLDFQPVGAMGFPFSLTEAEDRVLIDPRAHHDPVHNRLVAAYLEAKMGFNTLAVDPCGAAAFLHLSVSRDQPAIGSLGVNNWWYYTGPGPSGNMAFDLRDFGYKPYKNEATAHAPIENTARMPSIGFHTRTGELDDRSGAMIVAVNGRTPDGCSSPPVFPGGDAPEVSASTSQHVYIIPYQHDNGTKSILDGDQPQPGDITVIRPFTTESEFIRPDDSIHGWVVQEPYEQTQNFTFTRNATFIISTPLPGSPDAVMHDIRLKGLFYDAAAGSGQEWTLQQRVNASGSELLDIPLSPSLHYRSTNEFGDHPVPVTLPKTPDPDWGPAAQGTYFHSAVLARDNGPQGGQLRIFAVHAVRPATEDRWVAQWYVINPDLPNFHSTPAPSSLWRPQIVAAGRLESGGDSYHPTIVVNRQGVAFIEYTYSDAQTWPQVRRARLNNSYTGLAGAPVSMQAGPNLSYDENTAAFPNLGMWANIADAQADAFDPCFYWSTHTLVHDDPTLDPTPTRDVWIFRSMYDNVSCTQSLGIIDLDDDEKIDAYDLLLFRELFDQEARRVDFNGDGVVDAADATLFQNAYLDATGR
ncbi:MAG: dockerin type I repeat-containing protein [Phycisphaeraceae bacterium]|nr:dockerin type I repeat-containing protein [Phycisphaeraceae bacterium]